MKLCIYGGHYGSEGKGAAAEFWIQMLRGGGSKIAAFGENSPNSGHTCSRGKTKNIPASSFFADVVVLGPDSVIDYNVLCQDLRAVQEVNPTVEVYIHEHAAWMTDEQKAEENGMWGNASPVHSLKDRIGSTQSGSGKARHDKYLNRDIRHVCGYAPWAKLLTAAGVRLCNRQQFLHLVHYMLSSYDWVFECSQGALLDCNWGIYPYVTSRTTLPQAAIERNGLGSFDWRYVGVYRTFPIRTGGNSGPTGGDETSFDQIGVDNEIATVTKRIRRVFEFSPDDFKLSLQLTRPKVVMFTHLDYLIANGDIPDADFDPREFVWWLVSHGVELKDVLEVEQLFVSCQAGQFVLVPNLQGHMLSAAAREESGV